MKTTLHIVAPGLAALIWLALAGCPVLAQQGTEAETNQETAASEVAENINAGFLDAELDPQTWLDRFEVESREIFAARREIVDQLGLQPGGHVADIGAGTGLFLAPFSQAVTASGQVYALDISPRLVEYMTERAKKESLDNVRVVLSQEKSTSLPANSIDVVFVCDTYHHFEFYADMLLSIRNALKRGGELVIVDFERIPGTSREWVLGHVRAGKEQVKKEIQQAGFRFVEEVEIPGMSENYFLRFQRP